MLSESSIKSSLISSPSNHKIVVWGEFEKDCAVLAKKISEHPNFDQKRTSLYAVPRGGLCPTAVIAYWLHTKEVYIASPWVVSHLYVTKFDFFIDNLFDTGNTYQQLTEGGTIGNFACVYAKMKIPPSKVLLGKQLNTDQYLILPWETGEHYALHTVK